MTRWLWSGALFVVFCDCLFKAKRDGENLFFFISELIALPEREFLKETRRHWDEISFRLIRGTPSYESSCSSFQANQPNSSVLRIVTRKRKNFALASVLSQLAAFSCTSFDFLKLNDFYVQQSADRTVLTAHPESKLGLDVIFSVLEKGSFTGDLQRIRPVLKLLFEKGLSLTFEVSLFLNALYVSIGYAGDSIPLPFVPSFENLLVSRSRSNSHAQIDSYYDPVDCTSGNLKISISSPEPECFLVGLIPPFFQVGFSTSTGPIAGLSIFEFCSFSFRPDGHRGSALQYRCKIPNGLRKVDFSFSLISRPRNYSTYPFDYDRGVAIFPPSIESIEKALTSCDSATLIQFCLYLPDFSMPYNVMAFSCTVAVVLVFSTLKIFFLPKTSKFMRLRERILGKFFKF